MRHPVRFEMDRQIVCFQIPSFGIALARLRNPSLRDWPVAIAPTHVPRAVLYEVSSEARKNGLSPGMPVDQARWLCSSLQLIPPDPRGVRSADQYLLEVSGRFAPVWEPVSPGHLYLDLTGTTRLFGRAVDTAARIEREVMERHGLSGVMGLGSNKLVSGIAATLVQPLELYDVSPGSERTFLAPLPVTLLPEFGRLYAAKTQEVLATLDDLNLKTLGEIAEIPLFHLELVLGPQARLLRQWALGIDPSPVWPPVRRPSLEVSHILDTDEVDDDRLLGLLYSLLERLCQKLRRQLQACRRLTLTLGHSDGIEITKHQTFNPGTYWEADIYPRLQQLFIRSFQRRVRLRSVRIGAEALGIVEKQLSLFEEEPSEEQIKHVRRQRLALALDRLRDRFGDRAVWWGHRQSGVSGCEFRVKNSYPKLGTPKLVTH